MNGSEPFHVRKIDHGPADDQDFDELDLPTQPHWRRCRAAHSIEHGPWTGTPVCCMRMGDHEHGHLMALGDIDTREYWQETWAR